MPSYISVILSIIVALIALGGLAFLYFYWWLVQRPVPKIDGKLTLPILDAPVEVLRDKHGVPHIYAQSRADLFRAQGFTHAQDRMWQMEQNRRLAHGTMSVLFGEAALQIDRYSRIVGFGRAAQAELATLDPEILQLLTWYADGVNAYLQARKGRVAAEFNLLRRQPDPWTPLDTLAYSKMMAWSLSVNWEGELTRLQMVQQMDPTLAADLEPDYPADNPIILEAGQRRRHASAKHRRAAALPIRRTQKVDRSPGRGVGQQQLGRGPGPQPQRAATAQQRPPFAPHFAQHLV